MRLVRKLLHHPTGTKVVTLRRHRRPRLGGNISGKVSPFLRLLARADGKENAIVGNLVSASAVLYGLLLSLIAAGAFQNLSRVGTGVIDEAIGDGYAPPPCFGVPRAHASELDAILLRYRDQVVEREWPEKRLRRLPEGTGRIVIELIERLLDTMPHSRREEFVLGRGVRGGRIVAGSRPVSP
jgi:hypothetical protein